MKTTEYNPYGEVLCEIEDGLWEHDIRVEDNGARPYTYSDKQFRACIKIFAESAQWKQWEYMQDSTIEKRAELTQALGEAIRALILLFTGIDSRSLYEKGKEE